MRELSANDLKQSGKFAKIAKMFHYIYSVRRNPNTDTSDYQGLGTPDKRSYEREDLVFDPLHYLPLIERKVGALDQAAPLRGWDLPEAFATLRRLLEARMGPRNHGAAGKREYVQVLRFLEKELRTASFEVWQSASVAA